MTTAAGKEKRQISRSVVLAVIIARLAVIALSCSSSLADSVLLRDIESIEAVASRRPVLSSRRR